MKLLRVDMKEQAVKSEAVPAAYEHLGGRGLIAELLLAEVPPRCDALGPHNKLIFAPGMLGGAGVTTAGRLSIGGKSPLTGGSKEANAGGTAGDTLGKLGIKAMVVENQPARPEFFVLHVTADSAELLPAGPVLGLGTYATADALQKQFGEDATILAIGQAGGLGSFVGTFVGGIVLGLTESLAGLAISGSYREVVGLALFILVLIFRPQGLFGAKER